MNVLLLAGEWNRAFLDEHDDPDIFDLTRENMAQIVDTPKHGNIGALSNGKLIYTPAKDFTGTDTFTYKANDGTADSNIVTVSLTVTLPANTAPVAVADSYSTPQNTTLTVAAPHIKSGRLRALAVGFRPHASAPEWLAMMSTRPRWSMCWWVSTIRSRSQSRSSTSSRSFRRRSPCRTGVGPLVQISL